jgi:hypothetical protein
MQKIVDKEMSVKLLAYPAPQAIHLGGKNGNVVIKSMDKRVHKGWRLLSVDGVRHEKTQLKGEVDKKHRAPGPKEYTCTFFIGDEEPPEVTEDDGGAAEEAARQWAERVRREEREEEQRRVELEALLEAKRKAAAEAEAEEEARRRREAAAAAEEARAAAAEEERAAAAEEERAAAAEEARAAAAEKARAAAAEEARAAAAEEAERRKRKEEERKKEEAAAERKREAEEAALRKAQARAVKAAAKATGLPPRETVKEPQKALLSALTANRPAPVSKGPCDKCDGPHGTAQCPYFKGERDSHPDATSRYGKSNGGDDDGSGISPAERNLRSARVVRQPGDGSCLFHSLSHSLSGQTHSKLRKDIATFMARNPEKEIGGSSIRDWIMWDSAQSVADYARSMETGNKWGGAIEIAVCAFVSKRNVLVYEAQRGGYTCISKFESGAAGGGGGGSIQLLYGGRCHYDAIQ